MEQIELKAQLREILGSADARRIRRHGFTPAVLYGKDEKPLHLKVSFVSLSKIISKGENVIIDLNVGNEVKTVMVKEIQHDPVEDKIVHIDFYRVSLKEEVKINVPIKIVGDAVGVKEKGGVLEQILREIEVKCLPKNIPGSITIDVSALDIGDSIVAGKLEIPDQVEILTSPDATVVVVIAPTVLKEEKPVEEVAEPELIRKEKEAEEEGAEAVEEKEEGAEKLPKEEKKKEG